MFLEASEKVRFEGEKRAEIYGWVSRLLGEQQYGEQSRGCRGLLRRYVEKLTGLSRAQVTRLIGRYLKSGEVTEASYRRRQFPQHYTRADIELLASVDKAHETLSGSATKRILEREYSEYGHAEFERLADISVAHLYNLRKQRRYRECRLSYQKTRAAQVQLGERCSRATVQSGRLANRFVSCPPHIAMSSTT